MRLKKSNHDVLESRPGILSAEMDINRSIQMMRAKLWDTWEAVTQAQMSHLSFYLHFKYSKFMNIKAAVKDYFQH